MLAYLNQHWPIELICFNFLQAYPFQVRWEGIYGDPTQPLVVDVGSGISLSLSIFFFLLFFLILVL